LNFELDIDPMAHVMHSATDIMCRVANTMCNAADMMHGVANRICDTANMIHDGRLGNGG